MEDHLQDESILSPQEQPVPQERHLSKTRFYNALFAQFPSAPGAQSRHGYLQGRQVAEECSRT